MATKVYLIGAGPGDPELLTLRGQKLLKKADVVIYDYLVSKKILGFIKKTAEKISVSSLGGLYSDRSPHDQEAINRVLIQRAKQNKLVIRLKNGDPYLFGRGGWNQKF